MCARRFELSGTVSITHRFLLYISIHSPAISSACKDCIAKMLIKSPGERITLDGLKQHEWVTQSGANPMLDTSQNCPDGLIEISDDDIKNSIRTIPKLETLVSSPNTSHHPVARCPVTRSPLSGHSQPAVRSLAACCLVTIYCIFTCRF